MTIFEKPEDDDAFLRVLDETWAQIPLLIFHSLAVPGEITSQLASAA